MRKLKYFYRYTGLIALISILFSGCQKDDVGLLQAFENVRVWNNETGALHAKVTFYQKEQGRVSIKYWKKGENEREANSSKISGYRSSQSIPLYKLKENTEYLYKIILIDKGDGSESETYSFKTASVPKTVTDYYNEAENKIEDENLGYFLFHSMDSPGVIYLVDNKGKLVWYRSTKNLVKAARITHNNTILTLEDDYSRPFADGNIIIETSLCGDTLFYQKTGTKGLSQILHHDLLLNPHGHIAAITYEYKDGLPGDGIIVLDRQGNKMWHWSSFDHQEIDREQPYEQPWANSITLDKDNHFIVSFRAFWQVWKINSLTGEVMWKLGKGGDIPVHGEDAFQFQHFAHRDREDNILLFDNGGDNDRTTSRVVSFKLNESEKTIISQQNIFLPKHYYSAIMGSSCLLPDGNLLIGSAVNGKIIKMSMNGNIEWALSTADRFYRVDYVEDPFGD